MKEKKVLRALSLLLIVALAGAMFVSGVSAGSIENEEKDNSLVTLDYAKKVAQLNLNDVATGLPRFKEWISADIEYDMTFFDFNGDISAYSFSVIKNGEYLGFILVSGVKENYPILEFGRGDILAGNAKEKADIIASKNAKEKSYKQGSVKYLYLGSTFYYAQYELIDSLQNVKENIIVDLFDEVVVDLNNDNSVIVTSPNDKSDSDAISVNDAWSIVDDKIGLLEGGVGVSTSIRGSNTIYWVPLYDQPTGYPSSCAPTAAAMILSYWKNHGYQNLPTNGDTLIIQLYSTMETNVGVSGTQDSNIGPGIESLCQNYGYNNFDAIEDTGSFLFSEVKSEINSNRPMLLALHGAGTSVGGSTPYGDHSVTVVGWANGAFDAIEINDGWSTSETRYLTFNNWEDWTTPIYIQA